MVIRPKSTLGRRVGWVLLCSLVAAVLASAQESATTDEQITGLYRSIAELMYRAVRLGGVPCTPLPWRWGYGWPLCR